MTFKELKKFLDSRIDKKHSTNEPSLNYNVADKFCIFANKPFWISDISEHKAEDRSTKGNCCFNHIIGLPKKDGIEKPIFDYEMQLIKALDNTKSVWVKKARGLGITELLLRYMVYLAVRNNDYFGCRFHIVTGPRINLAEDLIDRLHELFMNKLGINCKQVGPIIYVKDTTIQAFPSHTSYSMRGYTNVKFILIDEAAYFPPGQQDEVRAVCEAYRPKSNPFVVVVSTPNKPGDFFETIDRDPNSIFKKLAFHYSVGLNKIYNPQEIEREKQQPYFKREFELYYAVGTGNVFTEETLQRAEQLGIQYMDRPYNSSTQKSLGIDIGFGSSATAFTVIEIVDNLIHVIYSKQFPNSNTDQMVMHAKDLIIKYNLMDGNNRVFINGSGSGFIRSVKLQTGEYVQYERSIEKARQDGRPEELWYYMQICPVNFNTKGKAMLANLKKYMDMGRIAIDAQAYPELMTELRIATSDEDMSLQKDQTSTMDLLDSLRLAMCMIK